MGNKNKEPLNPLLDKEFLIEDEKNDFMLSPVPQNKRRST